MAPPAPINKKYLCAAPRPEHWDDYASNALLHLGSTRKERERNLQRTIQAARRMHADSIKVQVGPGRKSNAEHAIAFYEYLSSLLTEGWCEEDWQEAAPSSVPGPIGSVADKTGDAANSTGDITSQESIRSINYKDNEKCIICMECRDEEQQTIVKCSRCHRMFHPKCHRPLEEAAMKEKSWHCSYCVLATEPKTSKDRHASAVGVRLMARIRNRHDRQRRSTGAPDSSSLTRSEAIDSDEGEDVFDEDVSVEEEKKGAAAGKLVKTGATTKRGDRTDLAESSHSKSEDELPRAKQATMVSPKEEAAVEDELENIGKISSDQEISSDEGTQEEVKPEGAENPSKHYGYRHAGDYVVNENDKTPDVKKSKTSLLQLGSPAVPTENDSGGRSKRNRKQPTLYDPQTVPAREWVSDEFQYSQSKDSTNEDSDNQPQNVKEVKLDKETILVIQRERRSRAKKEAGDDSAWCNFCCDDPDIPLCCFCGCKICFSKRKQQMILLCNSCCDEYHTFCLDPPLKTKPAPETWFCPHCRALRDKRVARETSTRRTTARKSLDAEQTEPPSRRSLSPRRSIGTGSVSSNERQNPRRSTKQPIVPSDQRPAAVLTVKRRGRPPHEPPRKRGRPPKTLASSVLPKLPIKKRKLIQGNEVVGNTEDISEETPSADVVTISRSGRTVKRNSFHDEIKQGDQNLRTQNDQSKKEDVASTDLEAIASSDSVPTAPDETAALIEAGTSQTPSDMALTAPTPANTPMQPLQTKPSDQNQSVTDALNAAACSLKTVSSEGQRSSTTPSTAPMPEKERVPRRKPGARECMQMSRRFGPHIIPDSQMETLLDYCQRGKVEHLIRMRERLDDHARYLEIQLAGLEAAVQEKGESDVVVPPLPPVEESQSQA